MDNSHPIYQETMEDEFDPQLDFAQFLKEAKTHECHHKTKAAKQQQQQHMGGRTNQKRTWKSCIFLWLKKADSKTTVAEREKQPPGLKQKASYTKSKTSTKGYVSGPMLGQFNHTKITDDEFQTPYVSLGRVNSSRSYGPVYLVT